MSGPSLLAHRRGRSVGPVSDSVDAEDLVVERWETTASGNLAGDLRWGRAPGVEFHLEVTMDGRLLEWGARGIDGAAIGARQLREAPIGAMERALRGHVSEQVPLTTRIYRTPRLELIEPDTRLRGGTDDELALWRTLASDFRDRPRTGVKGRSDRAYAALAACYVAAFERGEKSPVRAVADELGLGETTVRNYLAKARERGLLSAPEPGRAGGVLTRKASTLLTSDR
jgi:hypothetical protein